MRHHVTKNLGGIGRVILGQPFNTRIEDIRLQAPAVGPDEGNSEILAGKIERMRDDPHKKAGGVRFGIGAIFPDEPDARFLEDPVRDLLGLSKNCSRDPCVIEGHDCKL